MDGSVWGGTEPAGAVSRCPPAARADSGRTSAPSGERLRQFVAAEVCVWAPEELDSEDPPELPPDDSELPELPEPELSEEPLPEPEFVPVEVPDSLEEFDPRLSLR